VKDFGTGVARVLIHGSALGSDLLSTAVASNPSVVYFRAVDPAGMHAFYAIPVRGGPPRLLLKIDGTSRRLRPEFATDGRRIYFTIAEAESDVWLMELKWR
jgi:hypothetical protein